MQNKSANPYLTTPIGPLFARTALPIVLIMIINGLFTVVDALFLGLYAGAQALTAVTLTFPISMLMIALTTMVGGGMASLVARALGAHDKDTAQAIFISAHALALAVSIALAILFALFGWPLIEAASGHDAGLAEQGWRFMAISIYFAPVSFLLSVQGDALRSEGKAGLMAIIAVAATLLNIVFNYVLIGLMHYGTAGSAAGTIAAQALSLIIVAGMRFSGRLPLGFVMPHGARLTEAWGPITRLGLPPSLSFAGIALSSTAIIANVQMWSGSEYAATIAAYGVINRILTFAFLPLLGLNLASQSIVGNNFGARAYARSDATFTLTLAIAVIYAALLEATLLFFPAQIGRMFVDDATVIAEIERIVPLIVLTYVILMPISVIAGYFQALGNARMSGFLSLTKPYLMQVPLAFALPYLIGERGIWLAGPFGDVIMLVLVLVVLSNISRRSGARFGLFYADKAST